MCVSFAHTIAKVSPALANLVKMFGRGKVLVSRQSLRSTSLLSCPHCYTRRSLKTWTVYSHHAKVLNHYHLKFFRMIMKITWHDKIPDTDVLQLANMTSLHTMISKNQLQWSVHVVKMDNDRLPKCLFYGELATGK